MLSNKDLVRLGRTALRARLASMVADGNLCSGGLGSKHPTTAACESFCAELGIEDCSRLHVHINDVVDLRKPPLRLDRERIT